MNILNELYAWLFIFFSDPEIYLVLISFINLQTSIFN